MLISKNELALLKFSELIGEFIDYWGFKKIHGQTWALIYLSPQPMSATCLCQKLKVSKSLMSLAIKELLKFNVIRKASRAGKRTLFFESNPNMPEVIAGVLKNRECVLMEKIFSHHKNLLELVRTDEKFCHSANLTELGDMIRTSKFILETLVNEKFELEKIFQLEKLFHLL